MGVGVHRNGTTRAPGLSSTRPIVAAPPRSGVRRWLGRLSFALEHRTLKRIVRDGDHHVLACGHGRAVHIPRYCPHQGADLAKAWVHRDRLVCHWHGCQYDLDDCRFIVPNAAEKLR